MFHLEFFVPGLLVTAVRSTVLGEIGEDRIQEQPSGILDESLQWRKLMRLVKAGTTAMEGRRGQSLQSSAVCGSSSKKLIMTSALGAYHSY